MQAHRTRCIIGRHAPAIGLIEQAQRDDLDVGLAGVAREIRQRTRGQCRTERALRLELQQTPSVSRECHNSCASPTNTGGEKLADAVEATSPKLAAEFRRQTRQEITTYATFVVAVLQLLLGIYQVASGLAPAQITQIINEYQTTVVNLPSALLHHRRLLHRRPQIHPLRLRRHNTQRRGRQTIILKPPFASPVWSG